MFYLLYVIVHELCFMEPLTVFQTVNNKCLFQNLVYSKYLVLIHVVIFLQLLSVIEAFEIVIRVVRLQQAV